MAARAVQNAREIACLIDGGISEEGVIVLRRDYPDVKSPRMHPERAAATRSPDGDDEVISEEMLGLKIRQRKEKKKRTVAGVDQDELLDPLLLAEEDSCFYEFMGVRIHHKTSAADSDNWESASQHSCRLGLPIILLHGFAASLFSWRKVMKPLAHLVGSTVLAFDRPAFGLTSRVDYPPKPTSAMVASTQLNPYSTAFSSLVTLSFMDQLKGDKAILVGHSAGSLVAVDTYLEAPERVAALILVSPAIFAPFFSSPSKERELCETEDGSGNAELGRSYREKNMFYSLIWMIKRIPHLFSPFLKNLISDVIRSHIGIFTLRFIFDRYGIALVRSSWYDGREATEEDINGYKKPLRAIDWEKGVLEYIIALFASTKPKDMASGNRSLSEIACPVLIITGDHDRLVPAWNAKWLSRAIPGSHLKVMKNCGHLPHEERPEEFLAIVETFLSTLKETC
ncbi:unnamed protein product [Victoria cruziana]